MDTLLSELITALNKEIELHKQLVLLLQNDRHFLIDLSTEEIFENIKKKETCILKIKMLEESRSSLVDKLSQHWGIPFQELTLSKIVSLAEEPYRSSLATHRSTLTTLIKTIKEISQVNHFIINDSLYYFQRSLNFLNSASAASPTYVHSGKIKDPARFGSLLAKEV